MGYLEIVMIASAAVGALLGLMMLHFLVYAVIGIFARKIFPKADVKLKYGIIISARNEEKVIGKLIESVRKCKYPQELIDIFVVAHNCTDATAEVSRNAGAIVYEYDNPEERTVGYAYRHLFRMIECDYGTENYDGFLILNADNVVTENYLEKMNDAFVACGKKCVITSYRNSKNFGENAMSCLYGFFFVAACRLESRGRTVCGCSTRVSGTGYLMPSSTVKDGVWDYVTLTEDWEFSADQITQRHKIVYCDEAMFYDEQPTTFKIMWRQRMRWGKGHMDVFFTRFKKLFVSIFKRAPLLEEQTDRPHPEQGKAKKKRKRERGWFMSSYNMALEVMPLGVISVVLWLVQVILIALSPAFGYDAASVWRMWGIVTGICMVASYVVTVLSAVLLFALEHKRIGKVRFFTLLLAFLTWPFFLILAVVIDVLVLFVKKIEWKPIPHRYNKDEPAATTETTEDRIP